MLEDNKVPTSVSGNVAPGTSLDGTDASPGKSTKAELLEIDYVEQVSQAFQPSLGYKRDFLNPFPNQTPVNLLARPELVLGGTFGSTGATSSLLETWIARKKDVLQTFDFLRCDFIVRILIRCSASIYGVGLVSWQYGQERTNYIESQLNTHSSGMSYFMDFAGSDAVEFTIPYLFPREYWDLTFENEIKNYFTVYFDNIFKASIAGGSTDVNLRVYMNATNIDVGGYRPTPSVVIAESMGKPQTMSVFNPMDVKNIMNIATAGSTLAKTLANVFIGQAGDVDPGISQDITVADIEQKLTGRKVVSTNNGSKGVKITTYGDSNSIRCNTELAYMAETAMESQMFPETVHKLSDFVKRPSITDIRSFDSETAGVSTPINFSGGMWYRYIANHFRMKRGTLRIGLNFFTHPLISARFEIKFTTTGVAVANEGDPAVPTLVVLVKGSDSKIIDIPYTSTKYARQGFEGIMHIRVMDAPTAFATGIDPFVYCVITQSGADDNQFFSVCSIPGPDAVPPVEVVEPESLFELHSEPAEIIMGQGRAPKIPYLPEITTVEQLCKRWALRDTIPAQANAKYNLIPLNYTAGYGKLNTQNYGCKYDSMADCFFMARSGMDFRAILDNTAQNPDVAWVAMSNGITSTTTTNPRQTQAPENGISICNITLQPSLEYTAPFLSTSNGVVAGDTVASAVNGNLSEYTNTTLYAKARDGICLYHQNIIPIRIDRIT